MIRIKPFEWLHMTIPGNGRLGKAGVSGRLYMTTKRVAILTADGPVWEAPVAGLRVSAKAKSVTLATPRDQHVTWTSSMPPAWWGNAILFWGNGTIQDAKPVGGPQPKFGNIAELPDVISGSRWGIKQYNAETLGEMGVEGDIPDTDEFRRVSRDTNMILAALRHDGFHDGPPPTYHTAMLRRHAMTYVTGLVWGWRSLRQRMLWLIAGYGHKPWGNHPPDRWQGPDRWTEPTPTPREWYHEIDPACCGGHPYLMLRWCNVMIPLLVRVADELQENPGSNPHARLRRIYEAVRDGDDIPPPREALPLARAAAGNPW